MRLSTFLRKQGFKTESKYHKGIGYILSAWTGEDYMSGQLIEFERLPYGGWRMDRHAASTLDNELRTELSQTYKVCW